MAAVYCINAEGAMACRFWDALPPIKALLPERDQRCGKMCKKILYLHVQFNLEGYSPLWFQIQLLVTKWERHRENTLQNDHSKQARRYCVTNQNDATATVTCYTSGGGS